MTFLVSSLCFIEIADITANLKLYFSSHLNMSKVHSCGDYLYYLPKATEFTDK